MLVAEKDHPHHHPHDHHSHDHHEGHSHAHEAAHAHDHAEHRHGAARRAPSRFRSLIALSGLQRLMLALPVIGLLWLMAFWAMGWLE
jgi:ABC-type nickel/cobalt efflux system permease component RcnA